MTQAKLFDGKVALVSGAGRGIGAAIANHLAEQGAAVVVNDIHVANAAETAKSIETLGAKAYVSSHDISDRAQAEILVAEVLERFGKVDILINNAGIIRDGMLHKLPEDAWDDVIRVNLKGVFNLGQACAKSMQERKYGRIINFSSTSRFGNIGQSNYAAAKAGVIGLTRTWALELARYQITVNAVAPGVIDTEMSRSIPADIKEKVVRRIPLGRIGATQDAAHLVAFLASDQAGYVTGQSIQLDGGMSVGLSGD